MHLGKKTPAEKTTGIKPLTISYPPHPVSTSLCLPIHIPGRWMNVGSENWETPYSSLLSIKEKFSPLLKLNFSLPIPLYTEEGFRPKKLPISFAP